MIVCIMCPIMSLVATVLFKEPSFGTWVHTFGCNFPMALCWQMFYCGPLARFLFRLIFRRGKQWAYYKQVILYKFPVNKISGIKRLTTIWILYTRYTWSVYFCRECFILPQKMKRIAKKWLRNWLKWTVWKRNIVQDVRQFRYKREIRYNKK